VRANLRIARSLDEELATNPPLDLLQAAGNRGRLAEARPHLNVVELFAGAGGMGLGFLLADSARTRYHIVHSAELHSVYVQTLRHNHQQACTAGVCAPNAVPAEQLTPQDLRQPRVADVIAGRVAEAGAVDILIGGPPCQGFSSANRNSWSSSNPNNQLVDTFLNYVRLLNPRVLLMENVQGIIWTPQDDGVEHELNVAEHVARRLASLGYQIFPKLLDSAWYGVPQHRNRFFLLGIHSDLDFAPDDFGRWGPFPLPQFGPGAERGFVTVREAIEDLPPVGNGATLEDVPYSSFPTDGNWFLSQMRRGAPSDVIWDHVTSRHADYVIERYHRIPSGGNWEDIAEMMTNYADATRTHSNIYRRLEWDQPAITIGHYRKSMIVHPAQHRGLSLREAARLQSFPDWFRFAGSERRLAGGLTHKQQQLANAVCPLVTKAVAEHLLRL
jgi:DNA-cytosine methyltransferase